MGRVYICVATAQNTINALPLYFKNYDIEDASIFSQIKVITTDRAKNQGWYCNLYKYFKSKRENLSIIDLTCAHPSNIHKLIQGQVEAFEKTVINIGGGTKSMTISIMNWYNSLQLDQKEKVEILYPSIEEKKLFIYNNIINESKKLNVHLPLSDILLLYGEDKEKIDGIITDAKKTTYHHPFDYDNRQYFYKVHNLRDDVLENYIKDEDKLEEVRNQIVSYFTDITNSAKTAMGHLSPSDSQILSKKLSNTIFEKKLEFGDKQKNERISVNGVILNIDNQIFSQHFKLHKKLVNTGTFFELIAQNAVSNYLEIKSGAKEIAYNIKPSIKALDHRRNENIDIDILINHLNGEMLFFEVKTKNMTKKDVESLMFRLNSISGLYRTTFLLIPYFFRDFASVTKDENGNLENKYMNNLRNLPFTLKENGIPFCVMYDDENESDYILYKNGNEYYKENINFTSTNSAHEVEIKSYRTIIDQYLNKYI